MRRQVYALFSAGILMVAVALTGSSSADAADVAARPAPVPVFQPIPTVQAWTGAYGGVFAGYAGGRAETEEINGPRAYGEDTRALHGGALVGYQRQMMRYVFGVEAELGYLGADASVARDVTGGTVTFDHAMGLYGALALRGGYLVREDLLLYGRAGLVGADSDTSTTQTCALPGLCGGAQSTEVSKASTDRLTLGGVVGIGIEKRFAGAWSMRAEYNYFRFRDEKALPPVDGPGWTSRSDAHTLRVGLVRSF